MAAFSVTCPSCKKLLKSNNPIPAGKVVKCPACQKAFTVPSVNGSNGEAGAIQAKVPASAPVKKAMARAENEDSPVGRVIHDDVDLPRKKKPRRDDDEDYDDDRPAKKKSRRDDDEEDFDDDDRPAKKKSRRVEEEEDFDDDDRPAKKKSRPADDEEDELDARPAKKKSRRDDDDSDDDDRPRSKKKARGDDDDEEDEDDRPRKKKKKKKAAGSPLPLLLGLGGGGLVLIAVVVVLLIWQPWSSSGGGGGILGMGPAKIDGLQYLPAETEMIVGVNLTPATSALVKKFKDLVPADSVSVDDESFQDLESAFMGRVLSAKEPQQVAVMRFNKDVDLEKVKKFFKAQKTDSIKGRTVYREDGDKNTILYLADPKVLVAFDGMSDEEVGKLLENKTPQIRNDKIKSQFLKLRQSTTVFVVMAPSGEVKKKLEDAKKGLDEAKKQIDAMPEQARKKMPEEIRKEMESSMELVNIATRIAMFTGTVLLSPDAKTIKLEATAVCATAEDAAKAKNLIDKKAKETASKGDKGAGNMLQMFLPGEAGKSLVKDLNGVTVQNSSMNLTAMMTLSEETVNGLVKLAESRGGTKKGPSEKHPPRQPREKQQDVNSNPPQSLVLSNGKAQAEGKLKQDGPFDDLLRPARVYAIALSGGKRYQIELEGKDDMVFLDIEDARGKKLQGTGGEKKVHVDFDCPADATYRIAVSSVQLGPGPFKGGFKLTVAEKGKGAKRADAGGPPGGDKLSPADKDLRKQAKENLKEVMNRVLFSAESAQKQLPPAASLSKKDGKPLLSWRVHVLGTSSDFPLFHKFKLDEPWDSPNNIKLLSEMPQVYKPVGVKDAKPGMTCYKAIVGRGVAFQTLPDKFSGSKSDLTFGDPFRKIASSFPDGTKNVIGIVETAELVPWTKPEDWGYSDERPIPKLGMFAEGFHAAFMDGRVVFLSRNIDEKVFRSLIPRSSKTRLDYSKYILK